MELSHFSVGHEGREVFWNAEHFEPFLFLFTFIALVIFAYGLYRRWLMWSAIGKAEPEDRTDNWKIRLKNLLVNGLLQKKVLEDAYPGIMHALIFFGFLLLFFGAAFDASEFHVAEPLGFAFLTGKFYLFFSFLMDLAGLAILVGVFMALNRRYLTKPDRLGYRGKPDNTPDDAIALLLIAGIVITGFFIEALRITVTWRQTPWEVWSFVGWTLASAMNGISEPTARALHKGLWWVHTFLALGFIAYIPFSRLLHIVTTPANYYMATLRPTGTVEPIRDFENAESFGVGTIEEFTWKQLFDGDACTRCGRCQDGCPAYLTGKPLSPKKLTQDLKTYWVEKAPAAIAKKKEELRAKIAAGEEAEKCTKVLAWLDKVDQAIDKYLPYRPEVGEKALVGEVIGLDELWACTNCMYCMENCSAAIEHVPKIIGMRQYKVLMEADFAPELQLTYRNMENNSNPWGVGSHLRGEWAKDLGIKTLAEDPNVEYLFYVGCAGSFDDRGKKVSVAFAKILQAAGVSFGILGAEEGCCGDSAMRGGNEYLYQTLAQTNIEVMKGYGVKKIITTCPHGYNALKKDYPHFGGDFEVYHHTEFIAKLIAERKIKLKKSVADYVTYHDSCFLGRYNNIYAEPRKILKAVPGLQLLEMERNLSKSFCCGAGGARMWMEEHGDRINDARAKQAIETSAQTIAVGCPFCLTMMSDGLKTHGKEETMSALDIAEIVWKAMDLEEEKAPAEVCQT
ncbi:MAG TPA: heterodisulfide reductase-related iron-sulfur binding cluster [Syntrophales bacterium]|nr:heterodisulfide reductase-related iron-sulfur binding cluster [Syntrophales bacterium]HOL59359.1 heterodisulfide reductase-related iron-sulfur binding cluster [Syntrophales bacterium]HPO35449.1 heterodisulfide reductase-related iron-sulfur binding cluster [Syntrophales bacterium]